MSRRWSLVPVRVRLLLRAVFLLLALATIALALYVLRDEQRVSYARYADDFNHSAQQIASRLRHPSGQLALLNPSSGAEVTPLHPLLLPFSALDFDDPVKVQQAIEMTGCTVQYADGSGVCAAIGNNPWAGGFIYLAGSFQSAELHPHRHGDSDLTHAHRLQIDVRLRGRHYSWTAPFELIGGSGTTLRGRLTGFDASAGRTARLRPEREFRGWLWQTPGCVVQTPDANACLRRDFFSVRLPIEVLRQALFEQQRPLWPPADLQHIIVHLKFLPPGTGAALLDSDAPGALAPFALPDLGTLLLLGEHLQIQRLKATPAALFELSGSGEGETGSSWLDRLIGVIAAPPAATLRQREIIVTPLGRYVVLLQADARSANRALVAIAMRVAWFVGVMLLALTLAWAVLELGILRRINELRRRASAVSRSVNAMEGLGDLELTDLRGEDELGVLAAALSDLLRRVREDLQREQIRAEQEQDMWQAVGHEIMSPLQSLMALHHAGDNPSRRYISRMQQAVRVLYRSASPRDAFQSSTLQLQPVDLNDFLEHVATNASCLGIDGVQFTGSRGAVMVRADEHSLEDVVAHVLNNAARYRPPGSKIRLRLEVSDSAALVMIHNQGRAIPEPLLQSMFEYGVSGDPEALAAGRRGQGLFVARTYMAKMGGTISVSNVADGVMLILSLPRLALTIAA